MASSGRQIRVIRGLLYALCVCKGFDRLLPSRTYFKSNSEDTSAVGLPG